MESVLVKNEAFTVNGSDGVYGGTEFISMTCSLFLVKLQVSTIHDSDGVYDRAFLHPSAVVACFSEVSGLYYTWQ